MSKLPSEKKKKNQSKGTDTGKLAHTKNHGTPEMPVLTHQEHLGNQAVQSMLNSGGIQPKLKISSPNDKYEKEADRIAEQVVSASYHSNVQKSQVDTLQKRPINDRSIQSNTVPESIGKVINSGHGRPLEPTTREYMEERFGGQHFANVHIHTDRQASHVANSIGARAFTVGNEIFFGRNAYAPSTLSGKRLLAHELAHVLQQADGSAALQLNEGKEELEATPKQKSPLAEDSYKNEDDFIQAAELLYRSGQLKKGAIIYRDEYWGATAVGLSFNSFRLDLFSDMGKIRYIYRFKRVVSASGRHEVDRSEKLLPFSGPEIGTPPSRIEKLSTPLYKKDFITWAIIAIHAYEEAANQGLEDFEHSVGSGVDWGVFVANLLGNVIWAASVFMPCSAGQFLVSLAGIGLSSTAAADAATKVFDVEGFHDLARDIISHPDTGIVAALHSNMGVVTADLANRASREAWSMQRARQELLLHLVNSEAYIRDRGGVPMLDKGSVAAKIQSELLLMAASTKWKDLLGWTHGEAWVNYNYVIDNVAKSRREPNPRSKWSVTSERVLMGPIPTVREDFPNLVDRLNNIYGNILHQPMQIKDWPVRKKLYVLLRPYVGQVFVDLGPRNEFLGAGLGIGETRMRLTLGLREETDRKNFPRDLMRWLWRNSGGKPPAINSLSGY
jgi:hypothetical protein